MLNEFILSQIREAYNKTNKTKVRSLLKNAIKGKIVKKYKCLKYLKDVIPKTTKQSVKNRMSTKSRIVARLVQFYDENSTINPGKKAFRKVEPKRDKYNISMHLELTYMPSFVQKMIPKFNIKHFADTVLGIVKMRKLQIEIHGMFSA